jgi:hypothetical protein
MEPDNFKLVKFLFLKKISQPWLMFGQRMIHKSQFREQGADPKTNFEAVNLLTFSNCVLNGHEHSYYKMLTCGLNKIVKLNKIVIKNYAIICSLTFSRLIILVRRFIWSI